MGKNQAPQIFSLINNCAYFVQYRIYVHFLVQYCSWMQHSSLPQYSIPHNITLLLIGRLSKFCNLFMTISGKKCYIIWSRPFHLDSSWLWILRLRTECSLRLRLKFCRVSGCGVRHAASGPILPDGTLLQSELGDQSCCPVWPTLNLCGLSAQHH